MGEPGWNIDLVQVLCRKYGAYPFSEVRRPHTNVDGNVKRFTFHNTAKLGLRTAQLIVQSAQRPLARTGMAILDELIRNTKRGEFRLVISLRKETTSIAQDLRPKRKDARNKRVYSLQ